ncbi:MAG: hypothetical protein HWN65_15480 [Candidatus Helarchaeota archaeon]|nr:hypothetical protein [Candidatus Helarchaeota archaeon]
MPSSRTILTTFFNLIEADQKLKKEIDPIRSRLQRFDLRKSNARIALWHILNQLKGIDSSQSDAIDALMADLANKWQNSLGKALREKKIS